MVLTGRSSIGELHQWWPIKTFRGTLKNKESAYFNKQQLVFLKSFLTSWSEFFSMPPCIDCWVFAFDLDLLLPSVNPKTISKTHQTKISIFYYREFEANNKREFHYDEISPLVSAGDANWLSSARPISRQPIRR